MGMGFAPTWLHRGWAPLLHKTTLTTACSHALVCRGEFFRIFTHKKAVMINNSYRNISTTRISLLNRQTTQNRPCTSPKDRPFLLLLANLFVCGVENLICHAAINETTVQRRTETHVTQQRVDISSRKWKHTHTYILYIVNYNEPVYWAIQFHLRI